MVRTKRRSSLIKMSFITLYIVKAVKSARYSLQINRIRYYNSPIAIKSLTQKIGWAKTQKVGGPITLMGQ